MNLRKAVVALLLITAITIVAGCQQHDSGSQDGEYASIYIAVFDSYFDLDPGLHDGMEYLAIDMDTLTNAGDDDKKAVADYFADKFNIEIKDMSLEDLREQGLVNETLEIDGDLIYINEIDGLLLYINSVDISKNAITIEGTKFKSGNGVNIIESTLKKELNKWVLEGSRITVMA